MIVRLENYFDAIHFLPFLYDIVPSYFLKVSLISVQECKGGEAVISSMCLDQKGQNILRCSNHDDVLYSYRLNDFKHEKTFDLRRLDKVSNFSLVNVMSLKLLNEELYAVLCVGSIGANTAINGLLQLASFNAQELLDPQGHSRVFIEDYSPQSDPPHKYGFLGESSTELIFFSFSDTFTIHVIKFESIGEENVCIPALSMKTKWKISAMAVGVISEVESVFLLCDLDYTGFYNEKVLVQYEITDDPNSNYLTKLRELKLPISPGFTWMPALNVRNFIIPRRQTNSLIICFKNPMYLFFEINEISNGEVRIKEFRNGEVMLHFAKIYDMFFLRNSELALNVTESENSEISMSKFYKVRLLPLESQDRSTSTQSVEQFPSIQANVPKATHSRSAEAAYLPSVEATDTGSADATDPGSAEATHPRSAEATDPRSAEARHPLSAEAMNPELGTPHVSATPLSGVHPSTSSRSVRHATRVLVPRTKAITTLVSASQSMYEMHGERHSSGGMEIRDRCRIS